MRPFISILIVLALCSSLTSGLEAVHGTCSQFNSDNSACLKCSECYHLFEGQCYADISGCTEYVFGNICKKCDHGFILVNNECCDRECMAKIFAEFERDQPTKESA